MLCVVPRSQSCLYVNQYKGELFCLAQGHNLVPKVLNKGPLNSVGPFTTRWSPRSIK